MGKGWKQPERTRMLLFLVCLSIFLTGAGVWRARGQTLVSLIPFDQEWRYHALGGDLGVAWRTNDYDDSSWPVGRGLFQTGETTTYPAPFNTVLPPTGNNVTYYFRTRFNVPTNEILSGVLLVATNLVDDGCVIYLNGIEAGRTRMFSNPTYLSLATSTPAVEGQFDVTLIDSRELRTGENVLAVEVHQASVGGIDLVWGTHLVASFDQPLTITRQPEGQTNQVGEPVTVSVAVSGTPVSYQWWKDGARISGATGAGHSFTAANGLSGAYTAVATNRLMAVTSSVAQVLVVPDRVGPRLESAVVRDDIQGSGTNVIDLVFNESIQPVSVTTNTVELIHLSTGQRVDITNNPVVSSRFVRLRASGPEWKLFDEYVLTLNGIRDTAGNVVAPDTRVPVGWPKRDRILPFGAIWSFHNLAFVDPGVFAEDWKSPGYLQSIWWAEGSAGFYWNSTFDLSCGAWQRQTTLSYQPEPILFRTTFDWPSNRPSNAVLYLKFLVTDGLFLFLNGQEFYRYNFDGDIIGMSSRARFPVWTPSCQSNSLVVVSNLVSGPNTLAAALIPAENQTMARFFGLALDSLHYATPKLGSAPSAPVASFDATGRVRISWAGGGYALQTSTNLESPLDYPLGPWTEPTNQANPYVVATTNEPARYFRLKKK